MLSAGSEKNQDLACGAQGHVTSTRNRPTFVWKWKILRFKSRGKELQIQPFEKANSAYYEEDRGHQADKKLETSILSAFVEMSSIKYPKSLIAYCIVKAVMPIRYPQTASGDCLTQTPWIYGITATMDLGKSSRILLRCVVRPSELMKRTI